MNTFLKNLLALVIFTFAIVVEAQNNYPIVTHIEPSKWADAGGDLIINGNNFNTSSFSVRIGNTNLQVITRTHNKVIVKLPQTSLTGDLIVSNGNSVNQYVYSNDFRIILPSIDHIKINGSIVFSLNTANVTTTPEIKFGDQITLVGKDMDFIVLGREIEGLGKAIKFAKMSNGSFKLTENPYPKTVHNSRFVSPYPDKRYYYIEANSIELARDNTTLSLNLGAMYEFKTPNNFVRKDGVPEIGAPGREIVGMEGYPAYGVFLKKRQDDFTGALAFRRYYTAGSGKTYSIASNIDQSINFPIHTYNIKYSGLPKLKVTKIAGREGFNWEISRPNMGTADNHSNGSDVKFWIEGEGFSTNTENENVKLYINNSPHPIELSADGKNASFILKQDAGTVDVKLVRGGQQVTSISKKNVKTLPIPGIMQRRYTRLNGTNRPGNQFSNIGNNGFSVLSVRQSMNVLYQKLSATVVRTPWFVPNQDISVTVGMAHTINGQYLLPPSAVPGLKYKLILDHYKYSIETLSHTDNNIIFKVNEDVNNPGRNGNISLDILAVYPNNVQRVIKSKWINVNH